MRQPDAALTQQIHLVAAVQHRNQLLGGNLLQFLLVLEPLQHQQRLPPAGLTQLQGFIHGRHRQHGGIGQRICHRVHAVTIAIGLDHRNHAGSTGALLQYGQIVLQCGGIDQGLAVAHGTG